jgi:hypothetical protein
VLSPYDHLIILAQKPELAGDFLRLDSKRLSK